MNITTQRKSTKMKWQHNWKTSIELKILAYAQKIVTIALATYLAYGFLYPVLKKSIDIPEWLLGASIIFTLLVFELIFHFAFLDFVQGLFEKRIEWTSLIGATFILVVIAALGWFSTENLAYFRADASDKIQLINIDSLQNLKHNELSTLEKSYLEKEKGVDSLHLPLLKKAQDYPYLFIKAEKAYSESKDKLIKNRDKATDFTRRKWESEVALAKESNQAKISKVEKEDLADARSTSWISLVILFLSIYPSFVIAVYERRVRRVQNENTKVQKVQNTVQKEVQSVNVPFVVNVHQSVAQNVVSEKTEESPTPRKRISEKRELATKFYQDNFIKKESFEYKGELIQSGDLKVREMFAIVQEIYGISWGTFSDIHRTHKQE